MPATVDISVLRIGYVLDAPIYHDKNVKLLGRGSTITEDFVHQLQRRGIRKVQVAINDLAKLRGWKLSVDSPSDVIAKSHVKREEVSPAVKPESESRINPPRFLRYMDTMSRVGRQARTNVGPLKMICESAQLAADALQAEYFGFGLTLSSTDGMTVFLGTRASHGTNQKLSRYELELPATRSFLSAPMASGSPLFVEDLAADDRFSDDFLAGLQIESAAAVPLHRRTLRAGSMAVFYHETKKLDDQDLSFFETIANIVTVPTHIDVAELDAESNAIEELTTYRRYEFHCRQRIAPMDGEQLPLRSSFEEVLCHDISRCGISFYYPRRPEFTYLTVALGQPPRLKQMKATVVSCWDTDVDGEPCTLVRCRFASPRMTS
ncbi:MAG: GAF domain-containing protein [Pirellulaceae bacterium]|nr:GAF domain-containing protein [Pirellulaceae bacterium]